LNYFKWAEYLVSALLEHLFSTLLEHLFSTLLENLGVKEGNYLTLLFL
jgi:hypothetical protein